MSKKYKRTNTTITLSLNFNNEYEYGFTVDIDPREFTWKQVQELIGKNCSQEKFELRDLGPVLMNFVNLATRPHRPTTMMSVTLGTSLPSGGRPPR